MECPSGKYLEEIVTVNGLTIERPTEDEGSNTLGLLDWSGSESKFAEWDALAQTLIGRLEQAWMEFKVWPATARMPVAEYNALVDELNSIRERYSRVRKPWSTDSSAYGTTGWYWGIPLPNIAWDASEEIASVVGLIIDAQCLRQRLHELLAGSGGNPTLPGSTAHKAAGDGLGILGTAALVVVSAASVWGAIWVTRKLAKS